MTETHKITPVQPEKWKRVLIMLAFGIIAYFGLYVIFFLAIAQFLFTLFTNNPNFRLLALSKSTGEYLHQIFSYMLYQTEEKPFPFSDWP